MPKRVIVVIVEGVSDEALLIERLRSLFEGQEIRFDIQNGDIFYDEKNRQPIKNAIGDVIKSLMTKRKYSVKDILAVLHITDTDGCMIPEERVIVEPGQETKTCYYPESIGVCDDRQRERIIERNRRRRINLSTMCSVESVLGSKLSYQLYYFSRNIEHVVFDEPNPTDEDKVDNMDAFIESLNIPVEQFLNEHMPPLGNGDYSFRYKESWEHIAQGTHSLERCTNAPLLFEYIRRLI